MSNTERDERLIDSANKLWFIHGYGTTAADIRSLLDENKRMRELLYGLYDIEDSVTQRQERELRERWIPLLRAFINKSRNEYRA